MHSRLEHSSKACQGKALSASDNPVYHNKGLLDIGCGIKREGKEKKKR
jgi:hypothetical protein